MRELRVAAVPVAQVGVEISLAAQRVPFEPSLCGQSDDILVADLVTAALAQGVGDQVRRAEITGQTIGQLGAIPPAAVEQFSLADHALARGVL